MEYYSAINRNEVLIQKKRKKNMFRMPSSRMRQTCALGCAGCRRMGGQRGQRGDEWNL